MQTLDERIMKIVGIFHKRFKTRNVLKTLEEVEANTNEENLPSAVVVGELINQLKGFDPVLDNTGKITGYKTSIGGADTVFPFNSFFLLESGTVTVYPWATTIALKNKIKPKVIITYSVSSDYHNAVYWEPGAYGLDDRLIYNDHLLPYDVTDTSFKIKSANETTYTVNYWCFG
ncbi:MAG: hypothetical protein NC231_12270 [Bacillus sp. (in: Bacteria)]|nr:hypothetical protein [Bacillus sp. (in: firmicutes)]